MDDLPPSAVPDPANPAVAALLDGLRRLSPDQYKTFLGHALTVGRSLSVFDYPPGVWPPPTPARAYIRDFLLEFRPHARGRCVEFFPALYRDLLDGDGRITAYETWNLSPAPGVTVVADLQDAAGVPDGAFDTIVCTHVLSAVQDVARACAELRRVLAPGGMLLVTVPCVLQKYAPDPQDFWRFTRDSLASLLNGFSRVELRGYGNAATVAGSPFFLMTDHFPDQTLAFHDPECPSVLAAAAWA